LIPVPTFPANYRLSFLVPGYPWYYSLLCPYNLPVVLLTPQLRFQGLYQVIAGFCGSGLLAALPVHGTAFSSYFKELAHLRNSQPVQCHLETIVKRSGRYHSTGWNVRHGTTIFTQILWSLYAFFTAPL
jgi:hypothetical protein